MRNPPKKSTTPSSEQNEKKYHKRVAALEKQFDLGFITEEKYLTKRKHALMRWTHATLAESEVVLKNLNSVVRRKKLHLTRVKQDFMLLLTTEYATKEIIERWETGINNIEQDMEDAVNTREQAREQKKTLEDMFEKIKSSKD